MTVFGGKNSSEKNFPSLGNAAILSLIFSIVTRCYVSICDLCPGKQELKKLRDQATNL